MGKSAHIAILGGGAAGLAVGYYARTMGMPFTIYEAADRVGGNCVTLRHGEFLFDSGAHRLHDRDPEITEEMKRLLREDLRQVNVPSQIFDNGKFVDFPLSPLNLLMNLGVFTFFKAVTEVVRSRLKPGNLNGSFERFALRTYGGTIARRFLLNYSEKLWGAPCDRLSPNIAGERMKGLNLKTFLTEAILGQRAKTEHLEGAFYYPRTGIGAIANKLEESCGPEHIRLNSRITRILHDHARIQAVELNGSERADADEVVSTLPLDRFLQMMEPTAPEDVLLAAKGLRYRNVLLVAFFLDTESVTGAATVYFPGLAFPFTRIYEPRNRSRDMSPPGKTSLVAEVPCQPEDELWSMDDERLIGMIRAQLIRIGWVRPERIIDATVRRIPYAYPILELGFEERLRPINEFLSNFANLRLSGRNGRFQYAWIHNMLRFGREIVEELDETR